MARPNDARDRARATWAAGDWDHFARLLGSISDVVLDAVGVRRGLTLVDVGTGNGQTIAIPAALRGATVVGVDITPELLEHARRHAADEGVQVEWLEGDAADLPLPSTAFDRVVSTFGAMFAPEHARAAAELVRICRPGGRVAMTTWVNDGFVGEMFALSGGFLPAPPEGTQTPPQWGLRTHIEEMFGAAGVTPQIERRTVEFAFGSVDEAVREYTERFGPLVVARSVLEPQGRWDEFVTAFRELIARFYAQDDAIRSEYYLITVDRE
ncbi:MAG: methyltransferase domain-containing protein [Solirubrobacteraceae bacterium]|nr:methyltransferase domain-containing protein [Solirubrobacteraceae bacterium]